MAARMLKPFLGRQCPFKFISYRQVVKRAFLHTNTSSPLYTAVLLENKSHIKVCGEDAVGFLNGLVTNDINLLHCDNQMTALYCMMLNAKGRVLYDFFTYKLAESVEKPSFLLECDSGAASEILKTFKPFKLRSDVEFSDVSDKFRSWSVMEKGAHRSLERKDSDSLDTNLVLIEDPRLSLLGARLLLSSADLPSEHYKNVKELSDQSVYDIQRVRHGVSEGIKDIGRGVALPLEYNITELHGVSFQKGCYIGQELMARTHHTGVVRKRIMPVKMSGNNGWTDSSFDKDASIKTTAGKAAGKLKSTYSDGTIGLALMRLDIVKSAEGLTVLTSDGSEVSLSVDWPTWWIHE